VAYSGFQLRAGGVNFHQFSDDFLVITVCSKASEATASAENVLPYHRMPLVRIFQTYSNVTLCKPMFAEFRARGEAPVPLNTTLVAEVAQ